jgi:hypothetical protein
MRAAKADRRGHLMDTSNLPPARAALCDNGTRQPDAPISRTNHSVDDLLAAAHHGSTWLGSAAALITCLCLGGCALPAPQVDATSVQMPLQTGWFEGEPVFYLTTDVSDAEVARDKRANFAPRLADALPRGTALPGQPSSVDKDYAVTNFPQASIFASAPLPVGQLSRDPAYSPL